MATMKLIERPASLRSSRMPMTAKTAAMIATRSEIQARSDPCDAGRQGEQSGG